MSMNIRAQRARGALLDRINRIDRIDAGGEESLSSVGRDDPIAPQSVGRDVLGAPQSVGRDDPIAPQSVGRDDPIAPQDEVSHGATEARSEGKKTNEVFNAKNAEIAKDGAASDLPILPISTAKKAPSILWHSLTPSNTLVITWQNALLEREAANPVSFQAELFRNGNVVFRYDLSRISDEGLLTNVAVSVGRLEGQEGREGLEDGEIKLSRSLTSLSFKTSSEFRCDSTRAAFDDALGGLDPLSFPPGSTNTVWEHIVYTGTPNGAFALPSSTASAAVLRVAVSGSGRGELLVGDRAVPLVGEGIANTISHGDTEARSGGTVLDRINRIDRIDTAALTTFENSNPVNLA